MSETTIALQLIRDELSRQIAFACKEGISPDNLIASMIDYYFHKKGRFTNYDDDERIGFITHKIHYLKFISAIKFRDGKWFTTARTNRVLQKYFGK